MNAMKPCLMKCAFCNQPANYWHTPPPINGKQMGRVPICGGPCNLRKEKGRVKL